jgi:hypothetical protein
VVKDYAEAVSDIRSQKILCWYSVVGTDYRIVFEPS